MPIEPADGDPPGNLALYPDLLGQPTVSVVEAGAGTHRSHFATCPYASEFRFRRSS